MEVRLPPHAAAQYVELLNYDLKDGFPPAKVTLPPMICMMGSMVLISKMAFGVLCDPWNTAEYIDFPAKSEWLPNPNPDGFIRGVFISSEKK